MNALASLEDLFSRVADAGVAAGASTEAISALQFAAGAVRDERHRINAQMDAEIEVTEEMIRAGRRAVHTGKRGDVRSTYIAMEKERRTPALSAGK